MPKPHKKILLTIIPIVWGIFFVPLVVQNFTRHGAISYYPTVSTTLQPELGDHWYALSKDGKSIGYIFNHLDLTDSESTTPYFSSEESYVQTAIAGTTIDLMILEQSQLNRNLSPATLSGVIDIGDLKLDMVMTKTNNDYKLTLTGLGETINKSWSSLSTTYTPLSMYLQLTATKAKPHQSGAFPTLNALTQTPGVTIATFVGTETLSQGERQIKTNHFAITSQGLTSQVWLDEHGTLIREANSGYTSELVDAKAVRAMYLNQHLKQNQPIPTPLSAPLNNH